MPTFARSTLLLAVTLIGCQGAPDSGASTDAAPVSAGAADSAFNERDSRQAEPNLPVVLMFGDSITAGLGVAADSAYPALVESKADSAGLDLRFVFAGNSGETSAGGLRRITWFLDQPVDLFLLELGANDGLRGVPVEDVRTNLQGIIDAVRAKNPGAVIVVAGMQIPPNMGPEYTEAFQRLFPELAAANEAVLIPFLLEGVAGDPALNQADRIHPNVRGHQIVAETVWSALRESLFALTSS